MSRKLQRTEVCADCSAPGKEQKKKENRPWDWNNASMGATWWENKAEVAVIVRGSAEQENGQGCKASFRPKINTGKNRRVATTGEYL